MIEALSLPDPVRLAGAGAGVLAAIGLVLLLPLFLSVRRDLHRLRSWRLLEPDRGDAAAPIGPAGATGFVGAGPAAAVAAQAAPAAGVAVPAGAPTAQATQGTGAPVGAHGAKEPPSTDIAQPGAAAGPTAEPADVPGVPGVPPTVESPGVSAAKAAGAAAAKSAPPARRSAAPMTTSAGRVLTPAERVTADRPAVERITAEAPAIEPESGVHRVWTRFREPRHPLLIAAGALLIGAGIFLGSLQLLIDQPNETTGVAGDVVPEDVEVAVLNGTAVPGLEDNVSDDVEANGYSLGSTGDNRRKVDRTFVMFRAGHRPEARSVARALGVGDNGIRPLTRSVADGAGGADVVVVAGSDRVRL